MATHSFPPLRAAVLQGLVALKDDFHHDPDIFKDSPYDPETVDVLKRLFEVKTVTRDIIKEIRPKAGRGRPSKDVVLAEDDQNTVKETLKKLLKDVDEMGNSEEDKKLETSQRIQITKTKASIIEQLLKQQERILNVKRMSEFQSVVIGILEDLVSEKDREIFLERLEPFRD